MQKKFKAVIDTFIHTLHTVLVTSNRLICVHDAQYFQVYTYSRFVTLHHLIIIIRFQILFYILHIIFVFLFPLPWSVGGDLLFIHLFEKKKYIFTYFPETNFYYFMSIRTINSILDQYMY